MGELGHWPHSSWIPTGQTRGMTFSFRRVRVALLFALPLMTAACGDDAKPVAEATATSTTASTTTVPTSEPADPRDPRIGGAECEAVTLPSGEIADEFDLIDVTCDEAHAVASTWSASHDSQFTGEGVVEPWFCRADPGSVACVSTNQTQAIGWHVNPT